MYIYIYVCMYCIGRGCILVYPLVIRHCYGKWPVCFVCNDDFLQKSDCIGNHSGYPRMGWILSNSIHLWEIFRILKWRYVSTIFLAIFWYPLGLKIGIFFIVGTSNLGSWNGYWTYLYLSIRIPANPIKSNHNRHVDRVGHTIQVPLQPRCTQYMLLPSQLLGHWPAPLLGSFTFLRTMMLLMSLYIETEIDIDMYINIYIYIYVCILHVYIYIYIIYMCVCVINYEWKSYYMHIDSQDGSLRSQKIVAGHAKAPSQTGPRRHMRPWHAWLLTGLPPVKPWFVSIGNRLPTIRID